MARKKAVCTSFVIGDKPGVVLLDQVKSLDCRHNQAKKKGAVLEEALQDVGAKIKALLQIG